MVGFAGETEEEFSKSLAFVKEIGFAKTHVFAYSRRRGTVAYGLPAQITRAEKAERSRRMIEETECIRRKFMLSQIGRTVNVLFESKTHDGCFGGYTENYLPVRAECGSEICGEIHKVKILSFEDDFCKGEIL